MTDEKPQVAEPKGVIAIMTRLAAKPADEEWQLIETAKRKDGTRILAWDGKQQFTCYFRGEHHLPHQDKPGWHDQHIRMHPTHWKPLGTSPPTTGEPKQ